MSHIDFPGEASPHHSRQCLRDVGPLLLERSGLLPPDRQENVVPRLTLERASSRKHLVENDPKRPDIGACIEGRAESLLGTHVRERSVCGITRAQPVSDGGRAEVDDLRHAACRDDDIARLDVPVDDVAGVRGRQPGGDLRGQFDSGVLTDRPTRDSILQRLALVMGHGNEQTPVRHLPDLMDGLNVWVIEPGCCLGFLNDTAISGFGRRHPWWEHFYCDLALESLVVREIHNTHSTTAEESFDRVGADRLTGREPPARLTVRSIHGEQWRSQVGRR